MSGVPPVDSTVVHELTEAVTQLRRALRRGIRRDYSWESLPMAQVELLQQVREAPDQPVAALAAALRLAPSTVSTLLRPLLAGGLVVRATDEQDRRIGRLALTPAGEQQLEAWEKAHEGMLGGALAALTDSERRVLVTSLPALRSLTEQLRASD